METLGGFPIAFDGDEITFIKERTKRTEMQIFLLLSWLVGEGNREK